jgi:hypothetical protein
VGAQGGNGSGASGGKLAASRRRAWAEESLDRQNQERYEAWGRGHAGGTGIGPDVGGGDGGGGL